MSQEAWLPAPGLVCKHLRSFWRKVHPQTITEAFFRAFGQFEADFDLSHHSGRSQGSTAAEQGMPQMRLGRSRHSLQAASEDQNLQAELSANVFCIAAHSVSSDMSPHRQVSSQSNSFRNYIQEPTLK